MTGPPVTGSPCIIDCDPGIDDTLAILHAMGSDKVDLKAITLTYGNTNIDNVTRNLFTILHVLGKEVCAESLAAYKGPDLERLHRIKTLRPVIAVGASEPLAHKTVYGEDFHGSDGLGHLHLDDPDLAPTDWTEILGLLDPKRMGKELDRAAGKLDSEKLYTLSKRMAHDEILHQLEMAETNTLTLIAVGPLTNLALAYRQDPITFAKCKQVICMGGCIDIPGNVTPMAEFNFHACPTSVHEILQATMNKDPAKAIKLYMLPTDVTQTVSMEASVLKEYITPLQTPLSKFTTKLLGFLFDLLKRRLHYTAMNLHDPLCIGFFIDLEHEADITKVGWQVQERDIRIEVEGTLTRGMLVVDRRKKSTKSAPGCPSLTHAVMKADSDRYMASMLKDVWGVQNYIQ
ncbi:purine nucleosidase [Entomortierella parvispora]|uniref:Purine nucleosidase n=1 Tax=Entomortierella parvispora TaxID=205924 RepID=A0A9P3HJY4_9FUNG|nr:purine nucleosidase [Entomortierella parvispora]